jgi:hypothetical protein
MLLVGAAVTEQVLRDEILEQPSKTRHYPERRVEFGASLASDIGSDTIYLARLEETCLDLLEGRQGTGEAAFVTRCVIGRS